MNNKDIIISHLANVAFLLYAVTPICEPKEWLWYTVQITSSIILVVYVIFMVHDGKQKKGMLNFLLGTRLTNFFYTVSGIVGIIVGIALDLQTNIIFWSVVACAGAIEFFWPTKIGD